MDQSSNFYYRITFLFINKCWKTVAVAPKVLVFAIGCEKVEKFLRQTAHDQEVMGLNLGAVYWIDVIYYS